MFYSKELEKNANGDVCFCKMQTFYSMSKLKNKNSKVNKYY